MLFQLKSPGCQVLQRKMSSMKNITKLDVSENGFDFDIVQLMDAMQVRNSYAMMMSFAVM